jgi:hypothetical protein
MNSDLINSIYQVQNYNVDHSNISEQVKNDLVMKDLSTKQRKFGSRRESSSLGFRSYFSPIKLNDQQKLSPKVDVKNQASLEKE